MLGTAADVLDAHPRQRLLEFGLPAPHRVLAAVVGQYLGRLAVRRDAMLQGLHHQRGLLVVRERVTDHEAAVVVHEHANVQTLGTPQSKCENVRLPQLVRRRALEAPGQMLAFDLGTDWFDQSFLVQNPSHGRLRDPKRLEPREYVADSPSAPLLVLLLESDNQIAFGTDGFSSTSGPRFRSP